MAFQFSPKVVTDGLVLYLDAANSKSYSGNGSTWSDLSISRINGNILGSPTFSSSNNGIFNFNGVNSYINLGNQSTYSFTSGVFSVDCWVYVPSTWTGGDQYPNLISKGGSAGWDTDGWSLYMFRDYFGFSYGLAIRNGSNLLSTGTLVSLSASDLDKFVNITACMDLNSIKMFQNGILKKTVTTMTSPVGPLLPPPTTSTNVIIARGPNSQYFPGKIASVKLYNKKLSDLEVLQNYNATKSRFGL